MRIGLRSKRGVTLVFQAALTLSLLFLLFYPNIATCEGKKKFLWEIQSPKATVYVLGSIHLLNKESYPLAGQFEEAYRGSGTIVFEADMVEAESPKTQELMSRLGLFPHGESIREVISADTYRLLKKRLSASGTDVVAVERLRPWLCALSLIMGEVQRLGFNPEYGIDKHFFDKAKKDGKRMLALETMEEQLHLFSDIDPSRQDSLLKQTLKELDVMEELFREMILAWDSGDTQRLDAITKKSFDAYPEIYGELFVKRNLRWAAKIEKLLNQSGKTLVIVGAGHLAGQDNLISLLARKGFRITQR
jgi:uncharacterized protein